MRRLLAAALLGCAWSCAHAQEDMAVSEFDETTATASVLVDEARARFETGVASWYGPGFHGRKTASGEAFDMHALTAAHPKLPFGSWVRVRNMIDGRSVDVRINDRGPHVRRRIIDLSRAAARALGLVESGAGIRQVELTLLDKRR